MINTMLQYVDSTTVPVILFVFVLLAFILGLFFGVLHSRLSYNKRLRAERKDAVKRSRAVLEGQFGEQLAPFFPDFPCNATELRFIGKPVDFIAFQDASKGSISEVVFIEVKTGRSQLSPVERSLKECIQKGNIRYLEYRVPF